MSYDLLFNINENLKYIEAEFQIDNNPNYPRQRANGALINFVFVYCCCCYLPLLRDGAMMKDYRALEAGQLFRAWTRGHRERQRVAKERVAQRVYS